MVIGPAGKSPGGREAPSLVGFSEPPEGGIPKELADSHLSLPFQGDGHEGGSPHQWHAPGLALLPEGLLLHHAG